VVGRGTFRGRDVIWVKSLAKTTPGGLIPPIALDARTHRPAGTRFVVHGEVVDEQVYRFLGDVSPTGVSFTVPKGRVPRSMFPYYVSGPSPAGESSLREARKILGTTPLWLGPSFRGHPLRLVQMVTWGTWVGRHVVGAVKGVSLDYGIVRLEEFGSKRPFSVQGPRVGQVVVTGVGPVATLSRGGLLVRTDLRSFAKWHMNSRYAERDRAKAQAGALAVARALRPLPAGDNAPRGVGNGTASFADPIGDSGPVPDISRVQISPSGGDSIEFKVTVARHSRCADFGSPNGPMVAIDRDQNPDSGSGYYGTEVAVTTDFEGSPQLLRVSRGDLRGLGVRHVAGLYGACDAHGFELDVPRSALGLAPTAGFNVVVAALGPRTEMAPDVGTFNYQQVRGTPPRDPGPDTRAPRIGAFYAEALRGRVVELGYWVLDGRGSTGQTFRVYRGARLLKTIRIPLGNSNPFVLRHVRWHMPSDVHGRLRFTLRSVDAAGNASKLRSTTLGVP
jgi:hypothetical protein